jgi:thiol-disulfide isomerase/thioredoxin
VKSTGVRTFAALAAVAVAVVVIVGIVIASGNDGAAEPVALGGNVAADERSERQPSPPIAGPDPVTGEAVNVADFLGKPIVLSFWASWCGPCRAELPALQELADKHPEAQVVGVNFQDSKSDAQALQDELGFTFPSVSDDGTLAAQLGLQGMPTTFFLDDAHRVVGIVAGGTDPDGFEAGLELAQS